LRAIELLKSNLTATQREQFEKKGWFDVVGGTTGILYRIWYGYQLNVQQLDSKGRSVHWLCFEPRGHLPTGDVMLAQKLALEHFEADALRVARTAGSSYGR
jgi:hypothetical protein